MGMDFLRSFRYAFRGLRTAFMGERNARINMTAAVAALAAAVWLGLGRVEIALVIGMIALVLVAELINTVVERLLDLVHPDYSERVGAIKDVSAAAVLVTALGALGVACLLFLPRLVHLWR
jgi:diacylglycerol kinase (ATP)